MAEDTRAAVTAPHGPTRPAASPCPLPRAGARAAPRGAAGLRSRRREAAGAAPGAPEAPGFVCSGAHPCPGLPAAAPPGPGRSPLAVPVPLVPPRGRRGCGSRPGPARLQLPAGAEPRYRRLPSGAGARGRQQPPGQRLPSGGWDNPAAAGTLREVGSSTERWWPRKAWHNGQGAASSDSCNVQFCTCSPHSCIPLENHSMLLAVSLKLFVLRMSSVTAQGDSDLRAGLMFCHPAPGRWSNSATGFNAVPETHLPLPTRLVQIVQKLQVLSHINSHSTAHPFASCSGLQSQASDGSPTPPPDREAQHENPPPSSSYTVLHHRLCENAETKRAPNPECCIEESSKRQSGGKLNIVLLFHKWI